MSEDDKKADLMKMLNEEPNSHLLIDTRQQLAFWGGAIDALVEEGKIEADFKEFYNEQYSRIKVTLKQ